LIEQNLLRGHVKRTPHGREFIVVERASLANAKDLLDDNMSLHAVTVLLGLPKERVHELITAGFINEPKRIGGFGSNRVFSRREIASFIRRLNAGRSEPSEEEDLLKFSAILKTHLATEKEFIALVGAILSRQVWTASAHSGLSGFADISIGREQLYSWRSSMRRRIAGATYTVAEAAKELGVKQEVGYHLVETGLLHSSNGRIGRRKCRTVAGVDIDDFSTKYVSGAELARSRKTSPKSVAAAALEQGVAPVAGPGVDGCRQYFFKRADIASLGAKNKI